MGSELREDKSYSRLIREHSELFDRIMAALPEELKKDLLRYESMSGSIEAIVDRFYYEWGLMDYSYFLQMMGLCGQYKV